MAQWATFVGVTIVVLALLLVLARVSQSVVTDDPSSVESNGNSGRTAEPAEEPATAEGFGSNERALGPGTDRPSRGRFSSDERRRIGSERGPNPGTGALLVNVALSQGLFGGVLVAAAWYTEIPPVELGIGGEVTGPTAVGIGLALGTGLYIAADLGGVATEQLGFDRSEELRELLAPETAGGWILLLGGVLPVIAIFEELLFRAALIGAVAAGYGISPWLLAIGSSAAFAVGHGAQGGAGVVVTGVLGLVLAAAFALTNSLLVVVVAHYVVNALEFVVHEGAGVKWVG